MSYIMTLVQQPAQEHTSKHIKDHFLAAFEFCDQQCVCYNNEILMHQKTESTKVIIKS